jgi:hypothetical protein
MKRCFSAFVFFLLFIAQLDAQENNQTDKNYVPFIVGVSAIPSNGWGVNSLIGQKQWLKYDFNATSLTTYEGAITGKRIPFKLGVNAQFENNLIGKLHRFSGFIGSKRTMLRIQVGSIEGDARWTGTEVSALPNTFSFKNKYANIDLLYYPKAQAFFYFGVGYTSMKIPVQLNTLITSGGKADQKYGVAVYDTCFAIKTYSFLFGFGNMTTEIIKRSNPKKSRVGMFFNTQDKFGLGNSSISKKAETAAELMNPGNTSVGRNSFSALVEYNLALGAKLTTDFGRTRLVVAAGYEIAGALIASFQGAATKSGELGFDPSFFYLRYGFVFKATLMVF